MLLRSNLSISVSLFSSLHFKNIIALYIFALIKYDCLLTWSLTYSFCHLYDFISNRYVKMNESARHHKGVSESLMVSRLPTIDSTGSNVRHTFTCLSWLMLIIKSQILCCNSHEFYSSFQNRRILLSPRV